MAIGLTAVFVTLIVGVLLFAYIYSAERTRARQRVAAQLGFEPCENDFNFEQRVVAFYNQRYPQFYKLKNVQKKTIGPNVIYAFDLWMGKGRGTGNIRPTLAMVVPSLKIPRFALTSSAVQRKQPSRIARALIDYLAAGSDLERITLENQADFNDFYTLVGADASSVRKLFDAKVIDWFTSLRAEKGTRGVAITGEDGLLTWAFVDALPGDSDPLEHLRSGLERIQKLNQLISAH